MSTVYIAVYVVKLECPWVTSLKEKRSLISPLVNKIKTRYSLSAARLDGVESHTWETIGVSVIGGDRVGLERLLYKIDDFVASHSLCTVVESSVEVEVWSEEA